MENVHDTTDTTDTTLRAQLVCADCGFNFDAASHVMCTTFDQAAARLAAGTSKLILDPPRSEAELEREAAGYANLGANYFAARDIADRVMDRFSAEMFKPLVEKFTKQFSDELWARVTDWLIDDTRSNIASEINARIERTIEALLTGNRHYIDQFVLPAYSSHGEAIRAVIARAVPEELQQRRIKDLEEQVESPTRSLKFRIGVN